MGANYVGRFLYRLDFIINDGSAPSLNFISTTPLIPESFTFVTPFDKEFAGFYTQDAGSTGHMSDLAVWYNPLISIGVTNFGG